MEVNYFVVYLLYKTLQWSHLATVSTKSYLKIGHLTKNMY